MGFHGQFGCAQVLLDLVCYEMYGGRLSPEMQQFLERHMAECPACSRGMLNFKEILEQEEVCENVM